MRSVRQIPWLTDALVFPDPEEALDDPDGLLAAGGDLSPQRLLLAYRGGIFPWYNPGEPILWWSPDPRLVIYPGGLHVSRSLEKNMRRSGFRISFNQCFERVIQACSEPRKKQAGTWITDEMKSAYTALHRLGYAHSVECWQDSILVGGVYGLALGKCFFAESMFSRVTDASKTALVALDKALQQHDFKIMDCQVYSEHLVSLGAVKISRRDFIGILDQYA